MRGSTSGCVNQRQAGTSTNANVSTSKSVSYDVIRKTRESPTQVVTLPGQSKSAKNRLCSSSILIVSLSFLGFETLRGLTSGCVNQRQAGTSTNAYAVSPSSQAGPSKAASFAMRGNLSFTERAELQRLSSPPPTRRSLWTDTNVQRYAAPSP
ncbi:hypothetical protein YC2023_024786 [Brassica napus]